MPRQNARRTDGTRPHPAGAPAAAFCVLLAALVAYAAGAATKPVTLPVKPATRPATQPALGRPMPKAVPVDPKALTDQKIGQSIRKGVEWLLASFDPKTHALREDRVPEKGEGDMAYFGGANALAVYALMQAGLSLRDDPRLALDGDPMKARVAAMTKFDLSKGHPQTYAYGIRATALALAVENIPQVGDSSRGGQNPAADARAAYAAGVRAALVKDLEWCLRASDNGAYGYRMRANAPRNLQQLNTFYNTLRPNNLPAPRGGWDNSTSQYGLLGVWSAAETELFEIPNGYWWLVANHWINTQYADGQWGYKFNKQPGDARLSMTAAGLASLLVTYDYLESPQLAGNVGREPFPTPVKKALAWFERGDNVMKVNGGYTLYGIERVGLASGLKHFGQHDWYRALAAWSIARQKPDGSWGSVVETSYHLLFLARGRHPVLMNKLRHGGHWANRPRDAANLAKFAGRNLERPLNWQVVSSAVDWSEWTDSPILQVSSHQAIKFTDAETAKLRQFVDGGGMIFLNADGDSAAFNTFATRLGQDLFKDRGYEWEPVPEDHPLLTAQTLYNVKPAPPLKMITNKARVLLLHSPKDISRYWQARDEVGKNRYLFQFGVNLFIYAAGKRDLRNRIDSTYVAAPATKALHTTKVARLQYGGAWDPEPGAWPRFSNLLHRETGYRTDATPVKLAELKAADVKTYPLAHLTGTTQHAFTDAEAAALKAYVEAGGVVFIDACGGAGGFDASAQALLRKAFPEDLERPPSQDHPLLHESKPGMQDVSRRRLRPLAVERLGGSSGAIGLIEAGKGHVIHVPVDVTSGLLGTDTGGIVGYDAAYAQDLLRNVVFWTIDGQPKTWTRPPPTPQTQPATAPTSRATTAPATQPAAASAAGAVAR